MIHTGLPAGSVAISAVWLAFMNTLAFGLFWMDKRRSEAGYFRVPERTLLTAAFWGGSVGAMLAQQWLRHKTRKQPFRSRLIAIAFFHLFVLSLLMLPITRMQILNALAPVLAYFRG